VIAVRAQACPREMMSITYRPVDDAMGNAEALLHMKQALGLKIKL
jgi:hypothetical protein